MNSDPDPVPNDSRWRPTLAARAAIGATKFADEHAQVADLLAQLGFSATGQQTASALAVAIVRAARERGHAHGSLEAFLQEFDLQTEEGVTLLCLAESLLRVPDAATADRLIAERIAGGHWAAHLGHTESLFVKAATWALLLTGRVLEPTSANANPSAWLARLIKRAGEPVIRAALKAAMRIIGDQFVIAPTLEAGLQRAGERCASFDLLGEGARNDAQALHYYAAYKAAISTLGTARVPRDPRFGHGISVKLSALEPRYEETCRARVFQCLYPRVRELAVMAAAGGIGLTLDAEEADRLELSLDIFERLARDPALAHWAGLGLAVQAYQKRAFAVLAWVCDVARARPAGLQVRLVKGAYWDTEIKLAQINGLPDYPVFTQKAATDLSYLACAERLLAAGPLLYPQFATHNAATIAAVLTLAGEHRDFEFQRLYGMGESIYRAAALVTGRELPLRVYAPVGNHQQLLPYLLRRLLENGANTSFVNRVFDHGLTPEALVTNPIESLAASQCDQRLPRPRDILLPLRANSPGVDLADHRERARLSDATARVGYAMVGPIVNGHCELLGSTRLVRNPARQGEVLGLAADATRAQIAVAFATAEKAQAEWDAAGGAARADVLLRAAAELTRAQEPLIRLLVREAGKTQRDALDEWREAIDFCHYYAHEARRYCARPQVFAGPTGETNEGSLHGRGVFACISPWNFPLAIFTGQVAAALAAGNAVLAKPAEQTPLIAVMVTRLLHAAGVPPEVLHLLTGDGAVGAALIDQHPLAGVAFTGSISVAQAINRRLALKAGPITPLIAETGGVNALVVDSTALLEAVVDDVIRSGFHAAGQRCSALRVLLVQTEVADTLIALLSGAMDTLVVGDPADFATDIGPIIDGTAQARLDAHLNLLSRQARILHQHPGAIAAGLGNYFGPVLAEISDWSLVTREIFGPIVHLKRFAAEDLRQEIDSLRALGYGLTLGIHTRLASRAREIAIRSGVGNLYVNRNMVGAVVGVQPFGGSGLSGTGPKAGGPYTLLRFMQERTYTENTAATRGNVELYHTAK